MGCDGCGGIDRRAFLESALVALGAVGLAACGGSSLSGPSFTPFTVQLGSYPSLGAVGGTAIVDGGGPSIAVVRTGEASFLALSLRCPHAGVTVTRTATGFYCSGHGATFTTTGDRTSGPTQSNLRQYPTSYDANVGTLAIG